MGFGMHDIDKPNDFEFSSVLESSNFSPQDCQVILKELQKEDLLPGILKKKLDTIILKVVY